MGLTRQYADKHGYLKYNAHKNRVCQSIWEELRHGEGSAKEIHRRVNAASLHTVKHLLQRWAREGLVDCRHENVVPNVEAVYSFQRDYGPFAPVLRGRVTSGQGYTLPTESVQIDAYHPGDVSGGGANQGMEN